MYIDKHTRMELEELELKINKLLDRVIDYRQSTVYKADYRYIANKLQSALTQINNALDRVNK